MDVVFAGNDAHCARIASNRSDLFLRKLVRRMILSVRVTPATNGVVCVVLRGTLVEMVRVIAARVIAGMEYPLSEGTPEDLL